MALLPPAKKNLRKLGFQARTELEVCERRQQVPGSVEELGGNFPQSLSEIKKVIPWVNYYKK